MFPYLCFYIVKRYHLKDNIYKQHIPVYRRKRGKMKKNFIIGLVILLSLLVLIGGAFSETSSGGPEKRSLSEVSFVEPVHDVIFLLEQEKEQVITNPTILEKENTESNQLKQDTLLRDFQESFKGKIKAPVYNSYNSEQEISADQNIAWGSVKDEKAEDKFVKTDAEENLVDEQSINEQFRSLGRKAIDVENAIEAKTGVGTSLALISDIKSRKDSLEIISYVQEYDGIPVFDSEVTLVKKSGEVILANYNLYDLKDATLRPEITEEQAVNKVEEDLGASISESFAREEAERYSLEPSLIFFQGRLSWQVVANSFLYFVDAETNEILAKQDLARFALSVNGTVKGKMYAHDHTQTHQLVAFQEDRVNGLNGTYGTTNVTDGAGYYTLSGIAGDPFTVYSFLFGPYADVYNEVAPGGYYAYFYNGSVVVGSQLDWNWTDYDASTNEAESNVFYHMNKIHDYFNNGTAPYTLTVLDKSIRANISADITMDCNGGVPATNCNACYAGSYGNGMLFYGNGSGTATCNDTALGSDIIYHEYVHWVTDSVYNNTPLEYALQPGAMSEGYSDYFAVTINNDPRQGDNIVPNSWVRYLNNSYIYPNDFVYEVHDDSRMFAGAMWDLRQALGNDTAEELYLYALETKPDTFPEFLNYILAYDEILNGGNMNLWDGTPNSTAICDAFYTKHGIFSEYCAYYEGLLYGDYINDTVISIPDYNGVELQWVNLTINVTDHVVINDTQVYVDVYEQWIEDARIKLTAPNGTEVTLYNGSGLSGSGGCWWLGSDGRAVWRIYYSVDHLIKWWFDKELPPDGATCDGVNEMDRFNGMLANGTWTLSVADTWAVGTGALREFSLQIYSDDYVAEVAPNVTIVSPENGTTYTTNYLAVTYNAIDNDATPIDQCWYSLDDGSTNTTILGCNNMTFGPLSAGSYHLIIWANDTANYEGHDDVYFTLTRPSQGCVGATWTYVCGDYIPESCVLNANLSSAQTACFSVASDGITISGGNSSGYYGINSTNSTYGLYITSHSRTTVMNFSHISGFYYGIYVYGANFTSINNTISENRYLDIDFIPTSSDHCSSFVSATNSSGGRSIIFRNSTNPFVDAKGRYSEIILCNADNSNLTGTTVDGSASLDNNGILVYYTDESNFTNVTSSQNYYGLYLLESHANTINNSFANDNFMDGIEITDGFVNYISNNTLQENGMLDFFLMAHDEIYCLNLVENNTGSGDRRILYNFTTTTIEDQQFSEIELCNADNSTVSNVTINGSLINSNNGLILVHTEGSNFTDITSEENYYGMFNQHGDSNRVSRASFDSNILGVYQNASSYNTYEYINASLNIFGIHSTTLGPFLVTFGNTYDHINATDNIFGIISQWDIGDRITNSTFTSNEAAGAYVTIAGALFSDNTVNSNGFGVYSYWSYSSTFEDSSIRANDIYDFFSVLDDGTNRISNVDLAGPIISASYTDVGIKKVSAPGSNPSGYGNIGKFISIEGLTPSSQVSLNVSYLDSEVSGLKEATLKMYFYSGGSWFGLRDSGVDLTNNIVYSDVTTSFGTFAPLAESTSSGGPGGGGPGGGGGGGSQNQTNGTLYDVGDLSNYDNGVTKTLVQYDIVSFILDSVRHTMTVKTIATGIVTVEIASTPITVNLAVNKPYNMDLNGDGTNDFSIKLNSISGTEASITLSEITKPAVTEDKNKGGLAGLLGGGKWGSSWIYILVIAIVVIVFVVVIITSSRSRNQKLKKKR